MSDIEVSINYVLTKDKGSLAQHRESSVMDCSLAPLVTAIIDPTALNCALPQQLVYSARVFFFLATIIRGIYQFRDRSWIFINFHFSSFIIYRILIT